MAALVAALAVAGTAAAAVIKLGGSRSAPLSGRVPGRPPARPHAFAFTQAGRRYRIVFAPQLSGGAAGWRTFLSFGSGGGGEGGEAGYPTRTMPLTGGAGVGFTSSPLPAGDAVDYVLTSRRVAEVRLGDRTIQTRADPALPGGDRVAVFFVPAGSPPIAIPSPHAHLPLYIRVPAEPLALPPGWPRRKTPGHFLRDRRRSASSAPTRTVRIRATPLVALDSGGRAIPYTPPHPNPLANVRTWQRPRPGAADPSHAATHPLPGPCEISWHGLSALEPQWGHVLERIAPVAEAEGELFLSCVDTEFFLHGWPLQSAILLDAHRPGATLDALPGAVAVPDRPGVVEVPLGQFPGDIAAKRVGNAWLVVEGGQSGAQRLRVLAALRIARLALPGRPALVHPVV